MAAAPVPDQPPPSEGSRVGVGATGWRGLLQQFTGVAAVGCLIGLATVAVPLVFHTGFYVLPMAGLLASVAAIRQGQRLGGAIGAGLSALGGMLTLMGVRGG